jgi:hypothetical protein
MTSEGLEKMFEGNFADTCDEQMCADGKRGPESA